ncbi:MAG TPA: MFS transporter [Acidimicrobiales bacterium]|nr:MFS transporter [Acidimicrobiales bacterium]
MLRSSALRPLRNRDFALVWSAALLSNVGSWMQTVAVGVLVTAITDQARWTGLVAAAAFLPMGLLSPVGGALADNVDRRRWLLMTTVGETAFATLLAVLVGTGHATPLGVTLVVLGGGCMTALGFPAYQAILPDLVRRDELLGAMSLSAAQYNLGRVLGPAAAGVVLAAGSYTWAFALNAASFGAVLVALVFVRIPAASRDVEGGSLRSRIAGGARAAFREPGCRLAIVTIGVTAFLLSPFIALIPAVALKLFDAGDTGTSVLVTAQGVGAVAGALAQAPLAQRFGRPRVLTADLVVLPLVVTLYALAPNLVLAAAALVALGAAYIGILSGLSTVVQLRAPAAYRARIFSLWMVALGVIYPIGSVAQGALGDRLGLRVVTAGCAGAFLALVLATRALRPGLGEALDDPEDREQDGRELPPTAAGAVV